MRALAAVVACAAFAACAHAPDLPLRPDPAPPDGSTTETFIARDGTQLLARSWVAHGDTRAVVVIMHGLKDYSARYAHLADKLAAAGYAVYAFDLRGHGRSAGLFVGPGDWLDYVDDLDRFLTGVEQREPGKHVYLFGHSMGGAIVALTAERALLRSDCYRADAVASPNLGAVDEHRRRLAMLILTLSQESLLQWSRR